MLRTLGYAALVAIAAAAFAVGSAATADAKGKKKMAEPAPGVPMCQIAVDKAVCGSKGGMSFTYKNACYAERDGAKVVADKACAAKAATSGGKKKSGKKK